jgi:hypothetical protein
VRVLVAEQVTEGVDGLLLEINAFAEALRHGLITVIRYKLSEAWQLLPAVGRGPSDPEILGDLDQAFP